jgi:hypothetical protein
MSRPHVPTLRPLLGSSSCSVQARWIASITKDDLPSSTLGSRSVGHTKSESRLTGPVAPQRCAVALEHATFADGYGPRRERP